MKTRFHKFCVFILLMAASVTELSAADLNVAGVKTETDAARLLCEWAADIGYTAELSDSKKTVYIKDDFNYLLSIKPAQSGVDRILIYNIFRGKQSNVDSDELHAIVRAINREKNVCTAIVDNSGDLIFRYVLSFDDRLSPALFRHEIDHVKSTSAFVLKEFSDKLAPFYK
jgi:hypothetical protein